MTQHEPINTAIKFEKGKFFSHIKLTTALKTVSELTVGRLSEPKRSTTTLYFVPQK